MNLQSFIEKGITFREYYQDIQNLLDQNNPQDAMYQYYQLNWQRMQRLIKKSQLPYEIIEQVKAVDKKLTFLIITEGWCGDAAQVLPFIQKIIDSNPNFTAKIVYRDQNPDLIKQYLTHGAQAIPIIIALDSDTNHPYFYWGPRPKWGMELLKTYKENQITKDEFYQTLQKKYNQDKGQAIVSEFTQKLFSAVNNS